MIFFFVLDKNVGQRHTPPLKWFLNTSTKIVLPKMPYILFANSCITLSFEFYFHITVDSTNDIGSLNEHINTSVVIDTCLEKSFQNSFLHSYSSFKLCSFHEPKSSLKITVRYVCLCIIIMIATFIFIFQDMDYFWQKSSYLVR